MKDWLEGQPCISRDDSTQYQCDDIRQRENEAHPNNECEEKSYDECRYSTNECILLAKTWNFMLNELSQPTYKNNQDE
ncbi:hypothetical protein D3C76_1446790 [compost metagenome]